MEINFVVKVQFISSTISLYTALEYEDDFTETKTFCEFFIMLKKVDPSIQIYLNIEYNPTGT